MLYCLDIVDIYGEFSCLQMFFKKTKWIITSLMDFDDIQREMSIWDEKMDDDDGIEIIGALHPIGNGKT